MPATPTIRVLTVDGSTLTASLFRQLDVLPMPSDALDMLGRVNPIGRHANHAHALAVHRATGALVHVDIDMTRYMGVTHPRTIAYEQINDLPLITLGTYRIGTAA